MHEKKEPLFENVNENESAVDDVSTMEENAGINFESDKTDIKKNEENNEEKKDISQENNVSRETIEMIQEVQADVNSIQLEQLNYIAESRFLLLWIFIAIIVIYCIEKLSSLIKSLLYNKIF